MELKKCPFCLGNASLEYEAVKYMYIEYYVKCKSCGSRTGGFKRKEDAENLWNKRRKIKNG